MANLWMLSPFTTDGSGNVIPTCSAYANAWTYPMQPPPATAGTPATTIVHVQSATKLTTAFSTRSAVATFGTATTPGNLIIVSVQRIAADSANLTGMIDSGGNTYTQASNNSATNYKIDTFYSVSTSAATSITATCNTNSSLLSVTIHEYSGVRPLAPMDACSTSSFQMGGVNTLTIPATVAGELVFVEAGYDFTASGTDPFEDFDQNTHLYNQRSTGSLSYRSWKLASGDKQSAGGETTLTIGLYEGLTSNNLVASVTTFLPTAAIPGNSGLGLVFCQASDAQIAAAVADPTITVCSTNLQTPISAAVLASYAGQGAINNMSLAELLTELGRTVPMFLSVDPSLPITAMTVPYYSTKIPVAGSGIAHSSTNGVTITPFVLPYGVMFSQIAVTATGTDTTNLHSVGVFDTSGNLIVSSAPMTFPIATGLFPVAPTVLPAGMYYAAWSCNGATAISLGSLSVQVPTGFTTGTSTLSSGAVMPVTIVPPTDAVATPITAQVMAFSLF